MCSVSFDILDELQQCLGCLETVHPYCLMEDWRAERLPTCCACGEVGHASDSHPPLPPPREDPQDEDEHGLIPVEPETLDPERSEDFRKQLQGTGSTPCTLHGMDHLSRDPSCEFCKRALGPMY